MDSNSPSPEETVAPPLPPKVRSLNRETETVPPLPPKVRSLHRDPEIDNDPDQVISRHTEETPPLLQEEVLLLISDDEIENGNGGPATEVGN